jgi:hypothetical protein
VAGSTLSDNFPTTTGAVQPSMTGYADAFIAKYFGLVTLAPSPLTFAPQQVGTTSASQAITLTNMNASTLIITGITPSANFGETDNCAGSVAPSGSCTINVTFKPTVTGPLTGTLTITDNSNGVAGSTQSVDLSGIGTLALVSMAVTPANPSLPLGSTQQFTATATYMDGSMLNLTNWATWTSSTPGVATVSQGFATTTGLGATTIIAASGAINGSTTLTVTPGFLLTGSLNTARYEHTATLLNNGMMLIAGGSNGDINLTSAELYDPTTGTFTPTGSLNTARRLHTATLLNNGMVLIAGGYNGNYLTSAELYNPATGSFSYTTGSLNTARELHTATLLNNGMVLMAGGYGPLSSTTYGYLASAELYNPATGTFANTTGSLNTARELHTATLLDDGTVLMAGGVGSSGYLSSAELYNPAAGTFSSTTGTLKTARYFHTATLLNNGMVLMAGGYNGAYLATAELYNPAGGTFSYTTGSLNTARYEHTGTLLNNGMVLIAGGLSSSGALASAELYSPATETFALTGSLNTARRLNTATLLKNGLVLMAAGLNPSSSLAIAELYEPATLTPPNLVSISLSPSNPTVAVDNALRFTATGTFSDSSTQQLASATWSSSNSAVVSITDDASNRGAAYALAAGTATVSGCAGAVCGSTMLTSIVPAVHWPGPIVLPRPPSHPVPLRPPKAPTVPPPATVPGTGTEPVLASPGAILLPIPPPALPVAEQPAPPPAVPATGKFRETGKEGLVRSMGLTVLPLWPPSHPFPLPPLI